MSSLVHVLSGDETAVTETSRSEDVQPQHRGGAAQAVAAVSAPAGWSSGGEVTVRTRDSEFSTAQPKAVCVREYAKQTERDVC